MLKLFCDRCGVELSKGDHFTILSVKPMNVLSITDLSENYFVCPKCAAWITKEINVQERKIEPSMVTLVKGDNE